MGLRLHLSDLSQGRPVRTPRPSARPAAGVRPRAASAARTRLLLILVLVLLAHGLAFWLTAGRIPKTAALRTAPDTSRAIEVDLMPSFLARPSPQRPPVARIARPFEPAPPPFLPPVPQPPAPPTALPAAPVPPANPAVQGQLRDEAVRHALQSIVGCGDPDARGLTREQQANCFRKARPGAPIGAPLSPSEQAAFDADKKREGFLVRTPKNGCQPRVADRPGILSGRGGTGSMAASTEGGVSCAWSF